MGGIPKWKVYGIGFCPCPPTTPPRRSTSLSLRWRMSVPRGESDDSVSVQGKSGWENWFRRYVPDLYTPQPSRCETCARSLQMVCAQCILSNLAPWLPRMSAELSAAPLFAHRLGGSQKIHGDPNELWHYGFELLKIECRSVWKYGTPKFWWVYHHYFPMVSQNGNVLEWTPSIFIEKIPYCRSKVYGLIQRAAGLPSDTCQDFVG